MSASLVGSEMCIRDSTGPPGSGGVSGSLWYWARFLPAPAWARRSALSVSYTHLTLPTICSV
eukprot:5838344-Alexandrium_andersonii.AAC.1